MKKPIEGFPGYFVTDDGRVLSNRSGKEKELKLYKERDGYLTVWIRRDDGAKVKFKIHQLVARVFLSNPNNLPQINHKDENKTNNCVSNLEYCTAEYNANYGTRNKRISEAFGSNRSVICLETGEIWEYPNVCNKDLAKENGIKNVDIGKVINGSGEYKGYHYRYLTPDEIDQLGLEL